MDKFTQGYLDSLCGIYSIINAEKIINSSSDLESYTLFNQTIEYLDEKKVLKDTLIGGIDHRWMSNIMRDVVGERIPCRITNRKNFESLNQWWKYSQDFLEESEHRAIILSIGGKFYHLTTTYRMTNRTIFLKDSSGMSSLKKTFCRLMGYDKPDKHVIYYTQCWYLGSNT